MDGPFVDDIYDEEPRRNFTEAMQLFKDEEEEEEEYIKPVKKKKILSKKKPVVSKKRKAQSQLVSSFNRAVEPITHMCVHNSKYEKILEIPEDDWNDTEKVFVARYTKYAESFQKAVDIIHQHGNSILDIVKEKCKDNKIMLKLLDMITDVKYQEMHVFMKAPVLSQKGGKIQDAWTCEVMDTPKKSKNEQNYLLFNSKSDLPETSYENYIGVYIHKDGADLIRLLHTLVNFAFYMYNKVKETIPNSEDVSDEKWSEVWSRIVGEEFKGVSVDKWTNKKNITHNNFVDAIIKMRKIIDAVEIPEKKN